MFAAEERDQVRARLLRIAGSDPDVTGAAITGSHAGGEADQWSDIDLAFGVRGPLGEALERWTGWLYEDFGAVHHWDLPSGPAVYRVFLLPGWLEADIAFTPAHQFGPLGPLWRTVFGDIAPVEPTAPPTVDDLAGRAWHHVLHARVSIERHRLWQAQYWVGAARGQVVSLACLRLGYPTAHARGAHLLPPEVTAPLEETLVRVLTEGELRRALAAVVAALAAELERGRPGLAARLGPMLPELAGTAGTRIPDM